MIEAIKKYKRPLTIIAVLFIAFLVYSYFKGGSNTNNNVLTVSNPSGGTNSALAQQFFNQLLTLQKLNLDDRIFADPRFQNLEDFGQPLPDEPQGRPNPFAPIGVDVSYSPTIGSSTVHTYNLNFTSSTSSSSQ